MMHTSELFYFLGIVFVIVGWIGHYCLFKVARAVNARLPENERFSLWWRTFGKMYRLYQAHRRLYPDNRIRLYLLLSYGTALGLMIVCTILAAKALPHR
jgi:Trk-type K+ transport system membrane component